MGIQLDQETGEFTGDSWTSVIFNEDGTETVKVVR